MSDRTDRPPILLRATCLVLRADADVAVRAGRYDRLGLHFGALLLSLTTALACAAWTIFFGSFLESARVSTGLGLLVGGIVGLIDQAIVASDIKPGSVLRRRPGGAGSWLRLGARIGLAFMLAKATAVGVALALFSGAIDARLQADRTKANGSVEQAYAARQAALSARLAPLDAEILGLATGRDAERVRVTAAGAARDAARRESTAAALEAVRELHGAPGYQRGDGARHKVADLARREAERNANEASTELLGAERRLASIEDHLAATQERRRVVEGEVRAEAQALDHAKAADPGWVPARNDPMLRYAALRAIEAESGAMADFRQLAMGVLMTLELAVVLLRTLAPVPSAYAVALTADLQRRAAATAVEYEAELGRLRATRRREPPPMRIVREGEGGDR